MAFASPNPTTLRSLPLWDGSSYRGPCRLTWSGSTIDTISDPWAVDASGFNDRGYPNGATGTATHAGPCSGDGHGSGELDDLSIIPGLVDTHVHLWYPAGPAIADTAAWPLYTPAEERSLHVLSNALRCARFGVTTIRDMSSHSVEMAVARALDQSVLQGPHLLVNGEVGMTAGHGDLFTPPRARQRNPVADSPDECRALVRRWAREGTTGIKIYLSGGILSIGDKVGWRNQTPAEIHATVDEAHALGLQVAAHTHTSTGIAIALKEGVDSIEHATDMTDEQMAEISQRRIPVTPTLLINDAIAYHSESIAPETRRAAQEAIADRDEIFARAAAAGVRFVLGTDACSSLVAYGDEMEEVRHMASLFGWTAERALHAATGDAADSMRLSGTTGHMVGGASADFIVMHGRPWERIEDLRTENIVAVVCRGSVIAGTLEGLRAGGPDRPDAPGHIGVSD